MVAVLVWTASDGREEARLDRQVAHSYTPDVAAAQA